MIAPLTVVAARSANPAKTGFSRLGAKIIALAIGLYGAGARLRRIQRFKIVGIVKPQQGLAVGGRALLVSLFIEPAEGATEVLHRAEAGNRQRVKAGERRTPEHAGADKNRFGPSLQKPSCHGKTAGPCKFCCVAEQRPDPSLHTEINILRPI
ncbi:MAG: hypothetical protein R3C40_04390 [Parvularculaceae bacterium]